MSRAEQAFLLREMPMIRVLLGCCAVLILVCPVAAQAPPQPPDPTIRLTLHPAAEPTRALKYHLLPEVRDEIRGNAVDHYLRAMLLVGRELDETRAEQLHTWATMPTKDLPRQEVRQVLTRHKPVLVELDLAARCDRCDWDMRERVRRDGISLLLPDIQRMRDLIRFVLLRVRLAIAEHQFEEAAQGLRTGLAMARHAADSPILISALVGLALSMMMAEQIDAWAAEPGSPNLYWSLSALPQPLVGIQRPLQGERIFIDNLLPGVRESGTTTPLPARQLEQCANVLLGWVGRQEKPDWRTRLAFAGVVASRHAQARARLIADGAKAADLDALPITQVVLLDAVEEYEQVFDDFVKWSNMPYWKAHGPLLEIEARIQGNRNQGLGQNMLVSLLLPAMSKVQFAAAREERRFAALSVIEALRLYAAANGGNLPDKLDAITQVPIPIDPMTGKPFEYTRTDDKAVLLGPSPWKDGRSDMLRYELRMAPGK
jgi:hypothetical protein